MNDGRPGGNGRDETEKERLDRNLHDLLEGARVALPGVQVLFAFLLILPFQTAFAEITDFQRDLYYVTLILTALASVLLISPSARHRVRFRQSDKRWVVLSGNMLALAGLACLGLAITGAVLLVSDYMFSAGTAIVVSGLLLACVIWIWFAAGALRALQGKGDQST